MVGFQVVDMKNIVNFELCRQLQLVGDVAHPTDNWEGPFILVHQSFMYFVPKELE